MGDSSFQAYHAWNRPLTEEKMHEAMSLLTYALEIDNSNKILEFKPINFRVAF